ncbi:hypothetical protein BPAE_0124g00110 [Botrytis paeoniae]|uniref:Uncharacterized protein n=1 Tax=Botrytis paeoniae TaxID=278948 RepID=A0A4Z1FJI7_9HELO|nr:hypothetical protein BPAE_0124g00110 [Botrytis paeoniae]
MLEIRKGQRMVSFIAESNNFNIERTPKTENKTIRTKFAGTIPYPELEPEAGVFVGSPTIDGGSVFEGASGPPDFM